MNSHDFAKQLLQMASLPIFVESGEFHNLDSPTVEVKKIGETLFIVIHGDEE